MQRSSVDDEVVVLVVEEDDMVVVHVPHVSAQASDTSFLLPFMSMVMLELSHAGWILWHSSRSSIPPHVLTVTVGVATLRVEAVAVEMDVVDVDELVLVTVLDDVWDAVVVRRVVVAGGRVMLHVPQVTGHASATRLGPDCNAPNDTCTSGNLQAPRRTSHSELSSMPRHVLRLVDDVVSVDLCVDEVVEVVHVPHVTAHALDTSTIPDAILMASESLLQKLTRRGQIEMSRTPLQDASVTEEDVVVVIVVDGASVSLMVVVVVTVVVLVVHTPHWAGHLSR